MHQGLESRRRGSRMALSLFSALLLANELAIQGDAFAASSATARKRASKRKQISANERCNNGAYARSGVSPSYRCAPTYCWSSQSAKDADCPALGSCSPQARSTALTASSFQCRQSSANQASASMSSASISSSSTTQATSGLSKFHRSILSRTATRQRFVTGRYPLTVTVTENPTRKWLRMGAAAAAAATAASSSNATSRLKASAQSSSLLLGACMDIWVNGTLTDRSLASLDRFHWLDDDERDLLKHQYSMVSLEFLVEISTDKPGYVHLLPHDGAGVRAANRWQQDDPQRAWTSRWKPPASFQDSAGSTIHSWSQQHPLQCLTQPQQQQQQQQQHRLQPLHQPQQQQDRLWVTGFSLAGRKGSIQSMDCRSGIMSTVNARTASSIVWPNEVQSVPYNLLGIRYNSTTTTATTATTATTTAVAPIHSSRNGKRPRSATTDMFNHDSTPYRDALLVSDGFLIPTKDRGGLYVVQHPGDPHAEWTLCLTDIDVTAEKWFYHRATWVDLTGDGRYSILTARSRVNNIGGGVGGAAAAAAAAAAGGDGADRANRDTAPSISGRMPPDHKKSDPRMDGWQSQQQGQLVWLECPQPASIDPETGTPLESDGTIFDPFNRCHLPWKDHVLTTGPDVMFAVADMDPSDETIEVVASQFFQRKVSLHSIQRGPRPRIIDERIIDNQCGAAFACVLAQLDPLTDDANRSIRMNDDNEATVPQRKIIDTGSTTPVFGQSTFSHLLVTSHECSFMDREKQRKYGHGLRDQTPKVSMQSTNLDGGSLFAYRIPSGKDAWKMEPWQRSTIASGFKVQGQLNNMINPGAPGFVYTFYAKQSDAYEVGMRPMIAVAGDCAESAFLFRPDLDDIRDGNDVQAGESNRLRKTATAKGTAYQDESTRYKLMVEIKCRATVGSIGIGYNDFFGLADDTSNDRYAKLYIPCYEKDKILVFGLGQGELDYV